MLDNLKEVAIGTVYQSHTELKEALTDLTGLKIGHFQVAPQAGPNEIVQILANLDAWLYLKSILSIYGAAIVAEAGKDTWRSLAPKLKEASSDVQEKLTRVFRALERGHINDQSVSIGLTEPVFDIGGRSGRIHLTDLSPEEVSRHLYIFSHCVQSVCSWLSKVYDEQTEQGAVNVRMEITDNGQLVVELIRGSKEIPSGVFKRVYNAQGNVIEEYTKP